MAITKRQEAPAVNLLFFLTPLTPYSCVPRPHTSGSMVQYERSYSLPLLNTPLSDISVFTPHGHARPTHVRLEPDLYLINACLFRCKEVIF